MVENKVELEFSEDAWSILEDCRVAFGFDTIDDFISHILEKELERYDVNDNVLIKT